MSHLLIKSEQIDYSKRLLASAGRNINAYQTANGIQIEVRDEIIYIDDHGPKMINVFLTPNIFCSFGDDSIHVYNLSKKETFHVEATSVTAVKTASVCAIHGNLRIVSLHDHDKKYFVMRSLECDCGGVFESDVDLDYSDWVVTDNFIVYHPRKMNGLHYLDMRTGREMSCEIGPVGITRRLGKDRVFVAVNDCEDPYHIFDFGARQQFSVSDKRRTSAYKFPILDKLHIRACIEYEENKLATLMTRSGKDLYLGVLDFSDNAPTLSWKEPVLTNTIFFNRGFRTAITYAGGFVQHWCPLSDL